MNPKISFIIPTYKRPALLVRAILSIKESILSAHEIIVIDDSHEGEGAEATLPFNVTYIRKSHLDRRGLASNRNIGLKFAKGEYVVFIDDDDLLTGSSIEQMILDSDGPDMVCGNHVEVNNGNIRPINIGRFDVSEMLIYNRLPVGSYAIKRAAIRYNFDEDLRSHEDWDWLLKHINYISVKYFDLYPIAIEKSNNSTDSHMAKTREYFFLDFLSIYARYPQPDLAVERSNMLKSLGIDFHPGMLSSKPFINQHRFAD